MIGNDISIDGFGGIMVLEHGSGSPHRFWTFYGHLPPASLPDKAIGAAVERGADDRRARCAGGERQLAAACAYAVDDRALFRPGEAIIGPRCAANGSLGEHLPQSQRHSRPAG